MLNWILRLPVVAVLCLFVAPTPTHQHLDPGISCADIEGTQGVDSLLMMEARELVAVDCRTSAEYVRFVMLYRKRELLRPMIELIIVDPNSDPLEVYGALSFFSNNGIRGLRNNKHAVARLSDQNSCVRCAAIEYLLHQGSVLDAPSVVPLLSDEDRHVHYSAARALGSIGGKTELAAMDDWLKHGKHPKNADFLTYVKKCRDELEKRLK